MTHLRIEQSGQAVEAVSESLIKKLYDTALEIPEPELGEEDDAYMSGHISTSHTYKLYVEYLAGSIGEGTSGVVTSLTLNAEGRFLDLRIDVTNGYYIPFEDPNMISYLASMNIGTNGKVTETEAASVTVIANAPNNTITKFNELKYFTSITESRGGWTGVNSGYVRFCYWTALLEIDISNFTSLGHSGGYAWEDTFRGCTSLKKVTASNKLTKIGHRAFDGCSNLEEITGLSGTIKLSVCTFSNCSKLTSNLFTNCVFDINNAGEAFYGCTLLTTVNLSSNTTTIPNKCFALSGLTSINLPSSLSTIGALSFWRTSITSLDLSNTSVASIANEVFYNCANLASVNIGSNVQSIGYNAFYNCPSLTTFLCGNTPTLGYLCFYLCANLSSFPYFPTGIEDGLFGHCTSLQISNVPQNIVLKYSGHEAFNNCTSLQFPAQITVSSENSDCGIGKGCFENTNVQEVTFDTSIEKIYGCAFAGCTSLKKVNGTTNIKYLFHAAFENCSNLEGDLDFSNAAVIKTNERYYNQEHSYYCSGAFKNCSKITSVKLGDVEYFTENDMRFNNLDCVFRNCSMLHTVDVKSLTYIACSQNGRGMFFTENTGYTCPSMRNFVIRSTTVPIVVIKDNSLASLTMDYFGGSLVTIYVPDAAVNDYKTATGWTNIASNIKGLSEYTPITQP